MGLLSYIEKETDLKSDIQNISFSDFCKNNNFTHAALFTKTEDAFFITNSIGLDSASIIASHSSNDFWNGTIGSKFECFHYREENLNAFYQLFSDEIKDKIKALHIARINDNSIFIKIDTKENEEDFVFDFSKINFVPQNSTQLPQISEEKPSLLFLLSVNIAIRKAMHNVSLSENFQNIVYDSISNAFFNEFSSAIPHPSVCVKRNNGEIKIALFTNQNIEDTLLQHHISHFVTAVLGEASSSLVILKAGSANSVAEINSFFNEG